MDDQRHTKGRNKGPRLNTGAATRDKVADAMRKGSARCLQEESPAARVLFPFLAAVGWRGSEREFFESLPHFASELGMTELLNILVSLGFTVKERHIRTASDLDPRLLPAIFMDIDGAMHLAFGVDEIGFTVLSGITGKTETWTDLKRLSRVYIARMDERQQTEAPKKNKAKGRFVRSLVPRFIAPFRRVLLSSMALNFLALATPIFVMLLYDQVVPLKSESTWLGLVAGVCIALCFELWLRLRRARIIAYIGARIDHHITLSTFAKILSLPVSMTETATLGSQISKLRDFDGLREVFTSLLITVLVDLPFMSFAFIALLFIADTLALVPLTVIALYALVWIFVAPRLQAAMKIASKAKARRHSFLVETISNLRTVKEAAVETIWEERYRSVSADAALSHHKSSHYAYLLQALSQTLMVSAGLMTLTIGIEQAIADTLSVGSLIAAMALTWRILTPLQNLFLSLSRAEQLKMAIQQIDILMDMKGEDGRNRQTSGVHRSFQGNIKFGRVSFRYSPKSDPALLGVSFTVPSGGFLAVTGSNGSGKSSVLKVLLGLQRVQAGTITMDGIDIRQIPAPELRTAMAYVPHTPQLFHGSIAQNLRLGNPGATDQMLMDACALAGALDSINAMPDGFDTRIGDQKIWQLNSGFMQKLCLARAYATTATVLLLDEPANALDDEGDAQLMHALTQLRRDRTIIMVSHRPSHIRLADQAIYLERGQIVRSGLPDDVLKR